MYADPRRSNVMTVLIPELARIIQPVALSLIDAVHETLRQWYRRIIRPSGFDSVPE